ncbi:MAG: type II toxin-antitoxin system HicB family antitoxin [Chitinophagaceae bacterium]
MKTYHLPIIVETDEDGIFIVSCPVFKGCHSYGKTIDEALNKLKEVVEMCIEEQPEVEQNKFIGVREMEFKIPASA